MATLIFDRSLCGNVWVLYQPRQSNNQTQDISKKSLIIRTCLELIKYSCWSFCQASREVGDGWCLLGTNIADKTVARLSWVWRKIRDGSAGVMTITEKSVKQKSDTTQGWGERLKVHGTKICNQRTFKLLHRELRVQTSAPLFCNSQRF